MAFPFQRDSFQSQREQMVRTQLAARGIGDPRVLEAMRSVPRHEFVPEEFRRLRIRGFSVADWRGADDLATIYCGGDAGASGAAGEGSCARSRHRIGLCDGFALAAVR